MKKEFSFYSRPIKNLITTTNSLSSQIAINDKYAASYLAIPDNHTIVANLRRYLLSFFDDSHDFLTKKFKFQLQIIKSCVAWRTLFKPSLIKSLQLLKKFVNLYTHTFPEIEALINTRDKKALSLLQTVLRELKNVKISLEVTELYERTFSYQVNENYNELQSVILPELNKILTKESSIIEKLSNDVVLNQTNIDFLEKKITEITISLESLAITLTISLISGGNIFVVLAEIICIAALTATEVDLHEELNSYKQNKQNLLRKIKNIQENLIYFTHIKQQFTTLAETFKQTTGFFSAFKTALYDTVSKFTILAEKIKIVENKIETKNYYFLRASLIDMNKEFTTLKKKLQESKVLYNLPIYEIKDINSEIKRFACNKSTIQLIPNRLYFQYKINEIH